MSSLAVTALARDYDTSHLPYSDAPSDRATAVAISTLTDEGVLKGDPGGTIRPNAQLNRAEFMTIVMRLLPESNVGAGISCFPDVDASAWYAKDVCRAKALGIVRGNVLEGVAESKWRFEPMRSIQYEEAVKVLVALYALPTNDTGEGDWYVPFVQAANSLDLDVSGLVAGETITRGEMARLTAGFQAYVRGELPDLRAAENPASSSKSSSSKSSSSSSRTSTSSSRSSSSRSRSGTVDTLTGSTVSSNLLLTGEVSPLVAGVKFFSDLEPINVTSISINLMDDSESVANFLVYDQDRYLLGTATRSAPGEYRLNLASTALTLPRRENISLYIRARLDEDTDGATSGEEIQVDEVVVRGTGEWSNDDYAETSTESFPAFRVSRAILTSIKNVGDTDAPLIAGSSQILGEFQFNSQKGDSQANPRITSLRFNIESDGGATLSNVKLRVSGSDTTSDCIVSSNTVTCNNIPEAIGTVDDGSTTIQVWGDVAVSNSNSSLRLTLNNPGTISTSGDVTWTDGETTFTWVPFAQPVARGTFFND